ncbi:MAG: o-succinylbenzoate synthase [Arsenophonus sp.]
MRKATIYQFSLPIVAGIILRKQQLKTRDGFLIHLQENESEGWGEISPLPNFSVETLEMARGLLQADLYDWCQGTTLKECHIPSVAFGLSCAHAELRAELPEITYYPKAILCTGDLDALILQLNSVDSEKVAKVKVGIYESVRDGMVVNFLLDSVPSLRLRLDANQSWNQSKAADFAGYIKPDNRSRIDFIEEPCKTMHDSLAFTKQTGIAIAWDESVRDPGFQLKKQHGVSAIIIKPTLLGSLNLCKQLIDEARSFGLDAVISSTLESSFGLTQLARIARWLIPETVPGLDTLNLFKTQLIRQWPKSSLSVMKLNQLKLIWQNE